MYRDLLVLVGGGESSRRIEFAVELATRSGARLSGLHVTPTDDFPTIYRPSQVEAAAACRLAELATEAQSARLAYERLAMTRLSDAGWLETNGDIAASVSASARYADLVILGQNEWQLPLERYPLPVAHSVVLECGRPVLVVPDETVSANFARIAVAWDGSREAVRAIHDALPLLTSVNTVHLLTVAKPDENMADDADRLISHLANHGVFASSKVEHVDRFREHKALHAAVERGNYDLLVMGAYSHGKWVEFVVGGETRMTLLSSHIPVLVSH